MHEPEYLHAWSTVLQYMSLQVSPCFPMGASGLRESTGSALSFSLVRFKLLGLSSWNIGSAWAVDRCRTSQLSTAQFRLQLFSKKAHTRYYKLSLHTYVLLFGHYRAFPLTPFSSFSPWSHTSSLLYVRGGCTE